jgi:hypothetical protein
MNNPPAFPLHNHGSQTLGLHITGMSLRDYFAAKALQGLLANGEYWNDTGGTDSAQSAALAYNHANAMMEARDVYEA